MVKEDQAEELEILQSIYPDELEIIDESRLAIRLHLDTEPPRQLIVEVEYPDEYPESVIPELRVSAHDQHAAEPARDDDDGDDNSTKTDEPRYIYSFTREDCEQLKRQADEVAEENLGLPSVFTVVSSIKEQAEELYEARIRDQEAERLRQLTLEEEKEQAKFRGTPVTKESFAAWRLKFRHEMGWDKPRERPSGRLTGKEIFVRGLYKEGDEEKEALAEFDENS